MIYLSYKKKNLSENLLNCYTIGDIFSKGWMFCLASNLPNFKEGCTFSSGHESRD